MKYVTTMEDHHLECPLPLMNQTGVMMTGCHSRIRFSLKLLTSCSAATRCQPGTSISLAAHDDYPPFQNAKDMYDTIDAGAAWDLPDG